MTVPNISLNRLITKQKTSRHGGMKMDIYFSLSGHNSNSDSHGADFTESQRLRAHSQNRSSAPHPTNLQIPVCVAKYSHDQCQPHFMSDLRMILTYSQPQGPCFPVIQQTGCIRGTYGFLIIISYSIFPVHLIFSSVSTNFSFSNWTDISILIHPEQLCPH